MRYTTKKMSTLAFACSICASTAFAEETTPLRTIKTVQLNGSTQEVYLRASEGNWGPPSCPNALYVYITADVPDRKLMMATALTAKTSATRVQFTGTCLDQNYFKATYMILGE